jgi:superfamily II DNA or RNA helicase
VRASFTSSSSASTLMLASYEPVLSDAPELRRIGWSFAVIDEAHRLKNRTSVQYRCLLDELGLGSVPRLLLTGTPLQNAPDELFSLLHFVAPQLYDDAEGFGRWMGESPATAQATGGGGEPAGRSGGDVAQRLWRPLMLRRLKADHLQLPPKIERTVRVPLTDLQRQWYRALLEKNAAALGSTNARGLVNVLASLRKCCNHPYLFDGAEPEPFEEGEHLVTASAKLALLDRFLVRMHRRGDRVLLFCQSTAMLDVLQDYLHLRRWPYERLDGSARAEERWAAVSSFQGRGGGEGAGGRDEGAASAHSEPFVFLLSTRAGGLGLNLTAANVVVFFDHDWNPQADIQATDRVHRLGQTRPVLVLRLACAGTVEEVILRRAHAKMLVSKGVLDERNTVACGGDAATSNAASVSMAAEAIRFGLAGLYGKGEPSPSSSSSTAHLSASSATSTGGKGPTDSQLDDLLMQVAPSGDGLVTSAPTAPVPVASGDSIYIFDGVDFARGRGGHEAGRADEQAYDALVQRRMASSSGGGGGGGGGAAEGTATGSGAITFGRSRRGAAPLSVEEAAAEQQRLAAVAAEAERKRQERALERKQARWHKAGYVSCALPEPPSGGSSALPPPPPAAADDRGAGDGDGAGPSEAAGSGSQARASAGGFCDDSDGSTDDDEEEDVGGTHADAAQSALRFAVGDAMGGSSGGDGGRAGTGSTHRIVLLFTDTSGRWPSRGFFRSVSAASSAPQRQYEAACENADLAVGDTHLVRCNTQLSVAILVVFKRDKRAPYGTPPTLCLASLDAALAKLGAEMRRPGNTMSAHSPRLANTAGGSSWYAVERLLRKHLKRVQTTVYYFKRSAV